MLPAAPLRAALIAGLLVVAGCSIEPIREVQSPPSTPASQPGDLAFASAGSSDTEGASAVGTDAVAGDPAVSPASSDAIEGEAAAFTVATDTATVGVYSAPDPVYTLLDTLGPGDNVLGTGRRVDVDGVTWMEITWRETTAWALAGAFAPFDR